MGPKSRVIVIDLVGEDEKECEGCVDCACGKKEAEKPLPGLQEHPSATLGLVSIFAGIEGRISSLQERKKWPGLRPKKRLI
ncbi:MAG: hypothetical protein HY893_09775 [Deltaproteobacteria bacterium]|nr:hypothetical protein [Deltaproteobacteria bacterium]